MLRATCCSRGCQWRAAVATVLGTRSIHMAAVGARPRQRRSTRLAVAVFFRILCLARGTPHCGFLGWPCLRVGTWIAARWFSAILIILPQAVMVHYRDVCSLQALRRENASLRIV
jgi:hypothetical protein